MPQTLNRRQALGRLGAVGAGAFGLARPAVPARGRAPQEKLNLAIVGCGGQGLENLRKVAGENIVALCDVDDRRAAEAFKLHPKARRFRDYRKMLDALGRQIDAVVVSTPDHMHAPVSLAAMERGKHVYCEKPLTWAIGEARQMARLAKDKGLATQMGTQGMARDKSRAGIEVIRSGVLGKVTELHVWTDRAGQWWPQGVGRPRGKPGCPRGWTGACGWAWPRAGPTTRPTARSSGGGGRTSARGRWATWASTTPPCRSRRCNWGPRPPRRSSRPPS
ncbi:MAG TPA: Gfo/Idh/MocA family oxidoreductase [Gemmataceae bacterium]|jgi:hypothetical protein|nr:Gfo/Idh/MocA family oxidoreductase [Gemmataceae bacterium]